MPPDLTKPPLKSNNPLFIENFPAVFLKTPRNDLIRVHEIDSTAACLPNLA